MTISPDQLLSELKDWLKNTSIPERILWLAPKFENSEFIWVDFPPFYKFYVDSCKLHSRGYFGRKSFRVALSLLGFEIPTIKRQNRIKQSMFNGYRGHPVRFPKEFSRSKYVQLTLF